MVGSKVLKLEPVYRQKSYKNPIYSDFGIHTKGPRFLWHVQTRHFHLPRNQVTLNFPLLSAPRLSLCQLSADWGGGGPAAPAVLTHVGRKDERKPKKKGKTVASTTPQSRVWTNVPASPNPTRRLSREKTHQSVSQLVVTSQLRGRRRHCWGGPASRQADAALTDSLACLRGTDGSGAGLAANAEGGALSRRATCRLRCARADGTLALLLFPRAHCWTLRNR